jgi:hypothetical protein
MRMTYEYYSLRPLPEGIDPHTENAFQHSVCAVHTERLRNVAQFTFKIIWGPSDRRKVVLCIIL